MNKNMNILSFSRFINENKISEDLVKGGHQYSIEEIGKTIDSTRGSIPADVAYVCSDGILGSNSTFISWEEIIRLMGKYSISKHSDIDYLDHDTNFVIEQFNLAGHKNHATSNEDKEWLESINSMDCTEFKKFLNSITKTSKSDVEYKAFTDELSIQNRANFNTKLFDCQQEDWNL